MPTRSGPWLIRSGAFGDMVMLTAACEAAATKHGRPCAVIGTGPWNEPVFSRCPQVERIITLDSMKTPALFNAAKRQATAELRAADPAAVYICGIDQASHDLVAKARIPADRIRSARDCPGRNDEHVVDWLLRLIDHPACAPRPQLVLRGEDRDDARSWMHRHGCHDHRFILIQPGNKKTMKGGAQTRSSNLKYWPPERWRAVLAGLRQRHPEYRLVLCGTAEEHPIAADIACELDPSGVVNACGDQPIPRLLGLAEAAYAMLSVDTGPAHAAGAIGCPMVVLFGSTDPRVYLPRNSRPCLAAHALGEALGSGAAWWAEHHAMADLQPEHVLQRWDELLVALQ